jgi:small-conductance mechanosensitive channel
VSGQEAEGLGQVLDLGAELQGKVLLTLGAALAIWAIRWIVLRMVAGRIEEPRIRYQWAKGSGYVAFVVFLAVVTQIWIAAIRDMGTFLGLLTAGLAIALRDLVANMAGWAFILLRHPLRVGDRVQIGEHRGDVVDVRLFQFSLLEIGNWVGADQSTGRIIHVPNAMVFSDALANYTAEFPFVWHEIPVLVTFESDWRRAKELLLDIVRREAGVVVQDANRKVREASRRLFIHYGTLTPTVYTSVEDSGVLLTLRFICPVRQRRGISQAIWEGILDAFAGEDGIDLAYPTRRIYTNLLEGKEGARADLPGPLGGEPAPRPGEGEGRGGGEDDGAGEGGHGVRPGV